MTTKEYPKIKRTKLFHNDLIIKSTFNSEPGWYCVTDIDDGSGWHNVNFQRIVAYAVVEDWNWYRDGLPGQAVVPIVAGAGDIDVVSTNQNPTCVYLPDEKRQNFSDWADNWGNELCGAFSHLVDRPRFGEGLESK